MAQPDETKICVGAIAGAFGVRGEVRLKSFCADPEAIADYAPLFFEDNTAEISLQISRNIKGGFAARIDSILTREDAEAHKGTRIYALRDSLPALPDDEFYHNDLIGLEVMDTGGQTLGRITSVYDHGAGDLLELSGSKFKTPVLLPFTRETVPTIDLATGRIVVDPPEGLLDEHDRS